MSGMEGVSVLIYYEVDSEMLFIFALTLQENTKITFILSQDTIQGLNHSLEIFLQDHMAAKFPMIILGLQDLSGLVDPFLVRYKGREPT
jgi:hypothetical protein